MALWIERPSGRDISDREVVLTVKDENGLRACTIIVRTAAPLLDEAVGIEVQRIENDPQVHFKVA